MLLSKGILRAAFGPQRALRSSTTAFPKPRRFYKEVEVRQMDDSNYEVLLDKRTLRTPRKHKLSLDSYPLALAIAQEWDAQEEMINVEQMLLSGLQFTAVDNMANETSESLTQKIMEYLDTDTLLYFNDSPRELCALQEAQWLPLVEWANAKHELGLRPTHTLVDAPIIPDASRRTLRQYFAGMRFAELVGVHYGIEAIKSVVLMIACLHFHVDTRAAADLSNLETRYQTQIYEKVKGVHDVQEVAIINRLSAAILFTHLHMGKQSTRERKEGERISA